jgi:hypothetical protein
MRADAELRRDARYPILSVGARSSHAWDAMVLAAVPSAAPDPAQIRAMAFAASLGPASGPRTVAIGDDADDVVIDLAGEEALLGYLARVAVPAR